MKKILVIMLTVLTMFCIASCDIVEWDTIIEITTVTATEGDTKTDTETDIESTTATIEETTTIADTEKPELKVGNKVGNICISRDIELFSGETFNISKDRSKVTIINFWYTACGPCVKELSDFNKIAEEYNGDVMVYAIHVSVGPKPTVELFIKENFGDFNKDFVKFGWDEGNKYYDGFSFRDVYPSTVVVDEEGVIRYKLIGSAQYDDEVVDERVNLGLKSMVESILNDN